MVKNKWLIVILGAAIGFVNGFLGGGGGIIAVVVLTYLFMLPQKNAHATALLTILPVTVVSAVVYLINGSVEWLPALYATIGVVAGGALGALILKKLSNNTVKLVFGIILVLAGVRMFF